MAKFNISYIVQIIDKMTPSLKVMSQKLNAFSRQVKHSSRNLKNFGSTMTNFGKKAIKLGRSLSLRVSLPFSILATKIFKSGMNMEDTRIVFETMLGSVEKADVLLKQVFATAKKTPFTRDALLKNATLLLNFGVKAEKVIPSLKMLGDISGGNTERFNRLSLAFAQVSAMGRLTGQDLLQMVNAGFNPLQIISEKTGRSMSELKEIMSKGGISFKDVAKAMQIATSEGGRFFNMMEKRSETASGKFNKMKQELDSAFIDLGTLILPALTKFIEKLTGLIKKFNGLSDSTKKLVVKIIVFGAIIAPVLITLGILISSIGKLILVFKILIPLMALFNLAASFPLVTLAVGVIVLLLNKLGILKKFFNWILEKLGLLKTKTSEVVSNASNLKLEDINANFRQTLEKSTTFNSNSNVGFNGTLWIKNAPVGSRTEITPFGRNANLGLNMSTAPSGGI
jgi:tape measure domain-containing protein